MCYVLLRLLCVISALCVIEARGGAYVKLNGVVVWQGGLHRRDHQLQVRGVNVMIVDPSSCTLQEWRNFQTGEFHEHTAAPRLRDYLQGLGDGTVLVGVSRREASRYLSDALPTLSALGADVSDVGPLGEWVFAAVKGDPSKTVLDKKIGNEIAANERQIGINVTFGRCDHTMAE